MPKAIDDIKPGEKFGCLTIKEYAGAIKQRASYLCQCTCGNETTTESRSLKSGKTKSCGCLRRLIGQAHAALPYKDYIGKRFDRLTVLDYTLEHLGRAKSAHLVCQCDCGNQKVIRACQLSAGQIKSCGCKHEECKESFRRKRKDYKQLERV